MLQYTSGVLHKDLPWVCFTYGLKVLQNETRYPASKRIIAAAALKREK
jgi:hypothetical protein